MEYCSYGERIDSVLQLPTACKSTHEELPRFSLDMVEQDTAGWAYLVNQVLLVK